MDLEKQLAIHGAGKFELVDKSKTGKYKHEGFKKRGN